MEKEEKCFPSCLLFLAAQSVRMTTRATTIKVLYFIESDENLRVGMSGVKNRKKTCIFFHC
jgi:hypothetical protein